MVCLKKLRWNAAGKTCLSVGSFDATASGSLKAASSVENQAGSPFHENCMYSLSLEVSVL